MFDQWIDTDLTTRLTPMRLGRRTEFFRNVVYGPMASFADEIRGIVYEEMPTQLFGGTEKIYQLSLRSYISGGSRALSVTPKWQIDTEIPAAAGRLDLTIHSAGDKNASNIELKQELHAEKRGYGESERKKLTRMTGEAMAQTELRHYRAQLPAYVTELREYGVAILGPYCAIEGRLLVREVGGQWVIKESYTSEQDEDARTRRYVTSCPDGETGEKGNEGENEREKGDEEGKRNEREEKKGREIGFRTV